MTLNDTLDPKNERLRLRSGVNLSDVESQLPEVLRRLLAPHKDENEWLMALVANLCVSGSLIPDVWTSYGRQRNYPMLMLFVACPPASGKGTVGLSGKLLERINKHLLDEYRTASLEFQQARDIYKASLKTEAPGTTPIKPTCAQLLVPGDITSSRLTQQIEDNGSIPLVMVETEADVLSVSFKSEHGGMLSTLIRKAFHHERIALSRRTNDERVEINTPKMITVLTGTDNQILSVFKGNQDGLFSRFMFLRNNTTIEWRSGRPVIGSKPLDDHYQEWSEWFFMVWKQTKNFNAEVTFTNSQWDRIDKRGMEHQAQAYQVGGDYALSIARRHALIVTRMATILSFFRPIDPDSPLVNTAVSGWVCSDKDLDLALSITEISFQNSLELFSTMPQDRNAQYANSKKTEFFNALPDDCNSATINRLANTLKITDRTKARWIRDFCDMGMLEQVHRGKYKKTTMAAVALMALTQATDN